MTGRDPEVRYMDNNRKVANFSLATSERYKDKSGEVKENTEWHNISVWGKTADFIENYVKSGALLYVEGKLHTRDYTDKNGQKRTATDIVADVVRLISSKKEKEKADNKPVAQAAPSAPADTDPTDDLPF